MQIEFARGRILPAPRYCFFYIRTVRRTNNRVSNLICKGGTDWLLRETWHSAVSGAVFDLIRYQYTNGRPSYVEIADVQTDFLGVKSYDARYMQANWHGDLVRRVWLNGDASIETAWDPWGNDVHGSHYYRWNGAWGYMWFAAMQLYYVHGRWYNPDIGRFISPDDKGDYRYGSGDDAINWVWFAAGLQCQFWSDLSFGYYDNTPGQILKCQDNDGNVSFYYGQTIGRGLSNSVGGMEVLGGGLTFMGGGALTVGLVGAGGFVSVPAAAGGAVVGAHGALVLVHNMQHPPIYYARKSGTEQGIQSLQGANRDTANLGASLANKAKQYYKYLSDSEAKGTTIAVTRIRDRLIVTMNGGAPETAARKIATIVKAEGGEFYQAPGSLHAEDFLYQQFGGQGLDAIGVSNFKGPCPTCASFFRSVNFFNVYWDPTFVR